MDGQILSRTDVTSAITRHSHVIGYPPDYVETSRMEQLMSAPAITKHKEPMMERTFSGAAGHNKS
ncbi:hypothetical protein ASPCADRAFT_203451 [Aspergillus carbonarius ITEM 5010]|uniref:Uncharacterized protein n=1 Tax=Aspergillus carbonarius (strain ITEM 5010) TaxID=602072 RepID=A0A1R3RZ16_ASPC5|nr:hypothetical protein ASPCADRAFT_203451 [Aspergillus carbonarius ITEM 5010]